MKEMFLLVITDHHCDDAYKLYTNPERAIEEAEKVVKERSSYWPAARLDAHDLSNSLTPSMERSGWLFYVSLSEEGDSVHVEKIAVES